MSDFVQPDNRGSLFKNKKKTEPTHADCTGSLTLNGVAYWVNGWVKETRDGSKYLSLSIKPKPEEVPARKAATARNDFHSDEIPF